MVCDSVVFTFVVPAAKTPMKTAPKDRVKADFSGVAIDFLCIFDSLFALLGRCDISTDENPRLDEL